MIDLGIIDSLLVAMLSQPDMFRRACATGTDTGRPGFALLALASALALGVPRCVPTMPRSQRSGRLWPHRKDRSGRVTQPTGETPRKGVPMNSNRTKAAVVGALAGGVTLTLLSPISPALAFDSGGLHLALTVQSPATLVSRGGRR